MIFQIGQGDSSPTLSTTLTDNGPVDITGYNEVSFHMQNKYEEVVIDDTTSGRVNVVDAEAGEVEYVFDTSDTDTVGRYEAQWEVEYESEAVETFPIGDTMIVEVVEEIA